MFLGTLGETLLGNILADKGMRGIRAGEALLRAGYGPKRSSIKDFECGLNL